MTKEQMYQKQIHKNSYKITKEEAQMVWSQTNLDKKKELALDIISKLKYKNNYASELLTMNSNKIDSLIGNLIMAQELNKVIKIR